MQMQHSVIPATGSFPAQASNLNLQKYIAVGKFGKAEAEEAAVRLLMFSKENGSFVAVSWVDVMQVWIDEFQEYHQINEAQHATFAAENAHRQAMRAYKWKLIFTLGVGYFFIAKPTMGETTTPKAVLTENIFSPTLMFGAGNPQSLINGFWDLIEKGLIEKKSEGEVDYFHPTPALVAAFC